MCRYRYYYFFGCSHQHTVLFDFCEHAQVAPGLQDDEREASALRPYTTNGKYAQPMEGVLNKKEQDRHPSRSASLTPFLLSHESPQSLTSTGSRSVIAGPGINCASLHHTDSLSHPSSSSPTASFSHDMAGLQLFGFRQWMTGSAVPSATHETPAVDQNLDTQQVCVRYGEVPASN